MYKFTNISCLFFISLQFISIQCFRQNINNCTVNKLKIPLQLNVMKTIYQFNCFEEKILNPIFPVLPNSYPNEYNELDLSPNVFNLLPIEQICPFKYVQVLNMASNVISNLTGTLVKLSCLKSLSQIDLSNNLITSPLMEIDFKDSFAMQIQSLNFSMNKIPFIETKLFIRNDGTSRFTNLRYLNLANNRLKEFDLLWPLLLPSPSILIDLKQNPFEVLTNQMRLSFKDLLFNNPMVGHRYLDATDNHLTFFSDQSIKQYGVNSSIQFHEFLAKIGNYDLGSIRSKNKLICDCEDSEQEIVKWFRDFSKSVTNTRYPIFKLECSNFNTKYNIFDYPCIPKQKTIPPTTTATIKKKPLIEILITEGANNSKTIDPLFTSDDSDYKLKKRVQLPNGTYLSINAKKALSVENSNTSTSSNNKDLLYLIFLIIPFVIILFLVFICCIGRCCQVCLYKSCSCVLCPCLRPKDSDKLYDMTICYNENDDIWLNEQFMTQLSQFDRGFKIHKLGMFSNRSNNSYALNEDQRRVISRSKRLVLMFSDKFLKNEWSNKSFRDYIKRVYITDDDCVIVAVNLGSMTNEKMKLVVQELSNRNIKTNDNNQIYSYQEQSSLVKKISSRINHTCGLNRIEILNWIEPSFWKKFNYVMPLRVYDEITRISQSNSFVHKKFGRKNSIGISNSKGPELLYSNEPKIRKKTRPNRRFDVPILPITYKSSDQTSDADTKVSSVRQVIVPIPEEMRIKLGQLNKSKSHLEQDDKNKISGRSLNNAMEQPDTYYPEHYNKKKLVNQESYDVSESERRTETSNLPSVYKKRDETPEILANFKPEPSTRRKRQRARYLNDTTFNDTTKEDEEKY